MMRQLALAYPDDPAAAGRDDEFLFGPDLLAAPVLEPGATERSLYLPHGRWVDLWRSVAYREGDGSLRLRAGELLRGRRRGDRCRRRSRSCRSSLGRGGAPAALARESTRSATTRTTRPPRSPSAATRSRLLAFPRAKSSAQMFDGERIRSRERGRGWVLRIKGERRRTYRLQASLRTLSKPFAPCGVSLGGKPLRKASWDYDRKQRASAAKFSGQSVRLVARRRCG